MIIEKKFLIAKVEKCNKEIKLLKKQIIVHEVILATTISSLIISLKKFNINTLTILYFNWVQRIYILPETINVDDIKTFLLSITGISISILANSYTVFEIIDLRKNINFLKNDIETIKNKIEQEDTINNKKILIKNNNGIH